MNYKVVYGDTVSDIAKAYGVTIKEIKDANHLNDKCFIRAGLNLIIPVENSKNEDILKALVKNELRFDPFEDDEKLKGKYVSNKNYLDEIEITPKRNNWNTNNLSTINLSSKNKPTTNLSKLTTNQNKVSSKKETPTSNSNNSSKLKEDNNRYNSSKLKAASKDSWSAEYPTIIDEQTIKNLPENKYVKTKKVIDYYQGLINKDSLKKASSIHSYIKYIKTTRGKKAVVVSILRDNKGYRVGVFENGKLVSIYSNTGDHDNTYVTKIKH